MPRSSTGSTLTRRSSSRWRKAWSRSLRSRPGGGDHRTESNGERHRGRTRCACRSAWSGIIYESRPKRHRRRGGALREGGNACILRAAPEALESNRAIASPAVRAGLKSARLPRPRCSSSGIADRAAVGALVRLRGVRRHHSCRVAGKELIERLSRESQIPMIKHLDGVCHVYVDDQADPEMAVAHRRQREDPALRHLQHMETLLVAEAIAAGRAAPHRGHLPGEGRRDAAPTPMRGATSPAQDRRPKPTTTRVARAGRSRSAWCEASTRRSEHIAKYGSQHTDAIVTPTRRAPSASCARSTRAR